MPLHESTFEYLKPTDQQIRDMGELRTLSAAYVKAVAAAVPPGRHASTFAHTCWWSSHSVGMSRGQPVC